jgi:oxygen-dependent protoporphyrinogen oxidase
VGRRGAEESVVLLRTSIGRHREEQVLQRDDGDLVALAAADLGLAVGLHGPLVDWQVTRWGGGLPQYTVGHRGRVQRIRAAVGEVPRLEVCGAAYDGIGVAACVADGQRAATRVLAQVAGEREWSHE